MQAHRLSESSQWVDCGQGTLDLLTQIAKGHASLFPPSGSVQEQTIFTDSRWTWQDAWEWDLKIRKLEAEERRKTEEAEEERGDAPTRPSQSHCDSRVLAGNCTTMRSLAMRCMDLHVYFVNL